MTPPGPPKMPTMGKIQMKKPYRLRSLNPRKLLMQKMSGFKDSFKSSGATKPPTSSTFKMKL